MLCFYLLWNEEETNTQTEGLCKITLIGWIHCIHLSQTVSRKCKSSLGWERNVDWLPGMLLATGACLSFVLTHPGSLLSLSVAQNVLATMSLSDISNSWSLICRLAEATDRDFCVSTEHAISARIVMLLSYGVVFTRRVPDRKSGNLSWSSIFQWMAS